jgi:hypothetical protein
MKQVKDIYDAGDKISIAMFKEFDANFPDSITSGPKYNDEMLVAISIDSAGFRKRIVTTADSVVLNPGPFVKWEDIIDKPLSFYPIPHVHDWDNIQVNLLEEISKLPYLPVPENTTIELNKIDIPSVGNLWVYDYTIRAMKYWAFGNWVIR